MSTVPQWQPGTLYNPGATVRPVASAAATSTPIGNAGFEGGNTGWTLGTGWSIVSGAQAQSGTWRAVFGATTSDRIVSQTQAPVAPGQSITLSCNIRQGSGTQAGVELDWLDAGSNLIATAAGNIIFTNKSAYQLSTVTAIAPPGAAFARAACRATRVGGSNTVWIDNFSWNHVFTPTTVNLVFTAVQANAGFSGASEPTWPTVSGQQVVDNEVTWEALDSSRVVWEANPILVSGSVQPTWPTEIGATIIDGSIKWTAVSRRVEDEKCPNKPVVAIAASKVFCADDDIIAFSGTVNPLDWSTPEDAGYLPFGLQSYGSNPVLAMGLYRGNLIAFSASGFQMWQVDEDPANMALLDSVPVACEYPRTPFPVQNDLVFLSAVGVRNIGIAGASTNLQAGTFGEGIDVLVQAAVDAGEYDPVATFVPAYGQYWLAFGPQVFVLTISDVKKMSWSRYIFPEAVTDFTLLNSDLYIRTATDKVWRLDSSLSVDDYFLDAGEYDLVVVVGDGFADGEVIGYGNPGSSSMTAGSAVSSTVPWITVSGGHVTDPPDFAILTFNRPPPLSFPRNEFFIRSIPLDTTDIQLDGTASILVVETGDEYVLLPGNREDINPGSTSFRWEPAQSFLVDGGTYTFRFRGVEIDGSEPTWVPFQGVIHWPHLDFGQLGVEKGMIGFDLVCDAPEGANVSIGYDQRDRNARTPDYLMEGDSLPGRLVPFPVSGPSFDVRLTFEPDQQWEWQACAIYIQGRRPGA